MSSQPTDFTHYLDVLGFGLVHIPAGTKGPNTNGWQAHPITTVDEAARVWQHGGGFGLHHAVSRTAVLDIDHPEWTASALLMVDIDLEALLSAPGPKIRGAKGLKPVYQLPDGLELSRHALAWKEPGAAKAVTVFELRGGKVQDVLPPSIHPDTGKPYAWEPEMPRSRGDIPELPGNLRALWENWHVLKPVLNKAQPWAAPPPPRTYQEGSGDSVIAAFNRDNSPHDILQKYGYKRVGPDRYLSPHSSTNTPGIVVFKGDDGLERLVCYHASDPLYDDEHAHDAFSAWLILKHGGDIKIAVKEAARTLGMSYSHSARASTTSERHEDKTDTIPQEEPWNEPTALPGLYPPVPELPPELIPEPLRPWLSDIAERASLPLEFVACPALVAISAVVGRSIGIYPKRHDDWLVVPNLWGGIVGKPGVMKSAAISEPTKPLRALEAKAREHFQEAAARAEAERARLELEIAALKENEKRAAKGRYKS